MATGPLTCDACFSDWHHAHPSKIEYHTSADSETRAQTGQGHWTAGATVEANLSSGQLLPHDDHQVP